MAFPPKFECSLAVAACAVILSSFFMGNAQAGCTHSNADSPIIIVDFRGVEVAVNRVYEDGMIKYFSFPNVGRPCNGPECRSNVPMRMKSMPMREPTAPCTGSAASLPGWEGWCSSIRERGST